MTEHTEVRKTERHPEGHSARCSHPQVWRLTVLVGSIGFRVYVALGLGFRGALGLGLKAWGLGLKGLRLQA